MLSFCASVLHHHRIFQCSQKKKKKQKKINGWDCKTNHPHGKTNYFKEVCSFLSLDMYCFLRNVRINNKKYLQNDTICGKIKVMLGGVLHGFKVISNGITPPLYCRKSKPDLGKKIM